MNGHTNYNGFWPVSMLYLTLVHEEQMVLNISNSCMKLRKTRTFPQDLKGDVCNRQLSWVLPSHKFKHHLNKSCGNTIKNRQVCHFGPRMPDLHAFQQSWYKNRKLWHTGLIKSMEACLQICHTFDEPFISAVQWYLLVRSVVDSW